MDPMTAATIGVGGQMLGGKKAAKAQKQAAGAQERLTAPWVQAASWALPQARTLISGQLLPQVGKESPYLRTGLEQSLTDVGRGLRRGQARSQQFWGAAGNLGRGRGEQMRMEQSATETAGRLRLGYGEAQEAHKAGRLREALTGLGGLAELGGRGLGAALGATETRAQATTGMWEDIMGAWGGVEETARSEREHRRMMKLIEQLYGAGGRGRLTRGQKGREEPSGFPGWERGAFGWGGSWGN